MCEKGGTNTRTVVHWKGLCQPILSSPECSVSFSCHSKLLLSTFSRGLIYYQYSSCWDSKEVTSSWFLKHSTWTCSVLGFLGFWFDKMSLGSSVHFLFQVQSVTSLAPFRVKHYLQIASEQPHLVNPKKTEAILGDRDTTESTFIYVTLWGCIQILKGRLPAQKWPYLPGPGKSQEAH